MRCKFLFSLVASLLLASAAAQPAAHTLTYAPGKSITLSLPREFDITIAATGLKRPRFFAQAPDGRIFVTTMYNLADNNNGAVYILDGWNPQTRRFEHVVPYLEHLRNPNNLAFYTDAQKQTWLYLPLTDRLVRYRYQPGDNAPTSRPQLLTRFPDYGLNYKYGGWHLTRTVAVGTLHGHTQVFLTTGSSCNYCKEREAVRASLIAMEPDGSHQVLLAHGLRNAVDLRFVPGLDGGALLATNMGDDHLGDRLPEDTFFELDSNRRAGPIAGVSAANYGWPTCYFSAGKTVHDTTALPESASASAPATARKPVAPKAGGVAPANAAPAEDSVYGKQSGVAAQGTNLAAQVRSTRGLTDFGPVPEPLSNCAGVPPAYTTFAAHSSPLGLAWFPREDHMLSQTFLVALHGASRPRIGTGYRVVRFTPLNRAPQDFLTGFLTMESGKPVVHGRPCGIMRLGPDSFLITDDYLGIIYYIAPR